MATCTGFGAVSIELYMHVSAEFWTVIPVVGSWYCFGWQVSTGIRKIPSHSVRIWNPEQSHVTLATGSNTLCFAYGRLLRMTAFHLQLANVNACRDSSAWLNWTGLFKRKYLTGRCWNYQCYSFNTQIMHE